MLSSISCKLSPKTLVKISRDLLECMHKFIVLNFCVEMVFRCLGTILVEQLVYVYWTSHPLLALQRKGTSLVLFHREGGSMTRINGKPKLRALSAVVYSTAPVVYINRPLGRS